MRAVLFALALAACSEAAAPTGDPPLPGIATIDPVLTTRLAAATIPRIEKFTNRLALETSPYLLQHAHNPVSWYAWSDEAFERARREHKLVLVSIGYSTCHWCHVMEAESFSDVEVAAYLNASFICIKVDREERPDVDALYMTAVQAMGQSGGWPLNVIVDADRRPVFGATQMTTVPVVATAGARNGVGNGSTGGVKAEPAKPNGVRPGMTPPVKAGATTSGPTTSPKLDDPKAKTGIIQRLISRIRSL